MEQTIEGMLSINLYDWHTKLSATFAHNPKLINTCHLNKISWLIGALNIHNPRLALNSAESCLSLCLNLQHLNIQLLHKCFVFLVK